MSSAPRTSFSSAPSSRRGRAGDPIPPTTLDAAGSDVPDVAATRGAVAVTSSAPAYARGRYIALAIGNADYEHFPELATPIGDARAVAELLESAYGFETRVIENASRAAILDGIDETMNELSADDSLLIFYAGHGILTRRAAKATGSPSPPSPTAAPSGFPNSELRNVLRRSPAKHVLVIADSCFSGTLTRAVRVGRAFDMDLDRYYQKLASQKSRTALTSGGSSPSTTAAVGATRFLRARSYERSRATTSPSSRPSCCIRKLRATSS